MEQESGRPASLLLTGFAAILAAIAYAPLYSPFPSASRSGTIRFFFEPHQTAPLLILLVAGWLVWQRRARLRSLESPRSSVGPFVAFALAIAWGLWAHLNTAPDLYVFSIAAASLGYLVGVYGWRGCRILAVPLIVLGFALPIPGRLQNELIWTLQNWSAAGAHALLLSLGFDVARDGLLLTRGGNGFLVIESCSGFRSIHILLLTSVVLRDLFRLDRSSVLLFASVPLIAIALNVIRIAWIVVSTQAEVVSDEHLTQGVSVLIVGSTILFMIAAVCARAGRRQINEAPIEDRGSPTGRLRIEAQLAGALAIILILRFTATPWPVNYSPNIALNDLFEDRTMWTGEEVVSDRIFIGSVNIGSMKHRQMFYAGSRRANAGTVEAFLGVESRRHSRWSPFSDLLLLPGREWGVDETSSVRDWRFSRSMQEAIASRGDQRALVRVWRIGDEGAWVESLRSLFALEAGPLERARDRAVLRLVTHLDSEDWRDISKARSRLDQFVIDFGSDLDEIGL